MTGGSPPRGLPPDEVLPGVLGTPAVGSDSDTPLREVEGNCCIASGRQQWQFHHLRSEYWTQSHTD